MQNGCGVQAIPRDNQGAYSLPLGTLVKSGDTVLVDQHNPAMLDIAQGLTNSLSRDGKGGMLAPLQMGGQPVQNAGPGAGDNDLVTVGQLRSAKLVPQAKNIGEIRARLNEGGTVRIACAGDSVTDGYLTTGNTTSTDKALARLNDPNNATYNPPNAYPAVLQEYLSAAGAAAAVVFNAGYSGQTLSWAVSNFDAMFANMGALDIITQQFGLNDEYLSTYSAATFAADTVSWCAKVVGRGAVPVLMSPDIVVQYGGPAGDGSTNRRNERAAAEMGEIMRAVAGVYGGEFWDMNAAQVAHYDNNYDGSGGLQSVEQTDSLHGGDNHHAFKASFVFLQLMRGRVRVLPMTQPSVIPVWDSAASPRQQGVSQVTHFLNTRWGGNFVYDATKLPLDTNQNVMDVRVWNDGPETALFAIGFAGNGDNCRGMRLIVDWLSYRSNQPVNSVGTGDGAVSGGVPNGSGKSGSEEAQFLGMLGKGLNRIRFTCPATITTPGAAALYPPAFECIPNYANAPTGRQSRRAISSSPRLIAEMTTLVSPAGGVNGGIAYSPPAEDGYGRALVSCGPDAAHKTRLLLDAESLPTGLGVLLLDGPGFPTDFSGFGAGTTIRAGAYVYASGNSGLTVGNHHYLDNGMAQAGTVDTTVAVDATAVVTTGDGMRMLIDYWREGDSQRFQILSLAGAVVMDITRPITGRLLPHGGACGGYISALSAPAFLKYKLWLVSMSA